MPTSEARIVTGRASRYLVQLHRHVGQMRRMPMRPPPGHGGAALPEVERVEWSDTQGVIEFSWGRCTAEATADTLTLRAEAADADSLRRIEDGVARRLETIGRRDRLTVTWQRPDEPSPADEDASAPKVKGASRRPRHLTTLAITVVAVLVIAAHLGLLGGTLATSEWTGWGVNLLVALAVLKVIGIGVAHRLRNRRKAPTGAEGTPGRERGLERR